VTKTQLANKIIGLYKTGNIELPDDVKQMCKELTSG